MRKSLLSDIILKISYWYLTIPFLILITFWVKPVYAVLIDLVVLFCLFRMSLNKTAISETDTFSAKEYKMFAIAFVLIVLWVAISGIGGIAFQTEDHEWRNAMFETLVTEKWPVVKDVVIDGIKTTRGMSYYIGFWLPSAVVGKILGLKAGYAFQIFWAILGISLFYYGVCRILKKVHVWPLIIFIFWSGMDVLGYYMTGIDMKTVLQTTYLEWWTDFQFSGFTTQLFWVFNQAIPAWVAVIISYIQKENRYMIFILASSMLNCTLPFVGMLPLVAYWMLTRSYDGDRWNKSWLKPWVKDTFTVENVLGGGVIGIISYLYLRKSQSGGGGISLYSLSNGGWLVVLLFLLLEVGILWIILFHYQKKNPLFYICMIWLVICPILVMYGETNFCMRASIPALLLMYLYTVQTLEKAYSEKHYKHLIVIGLILAIGAIAPWHSIVINVSETHNRHLLETPVRAESVGTERVLSNKYESCDIKENYFFRYLAKEKEHSIYEY